MAFLDTTSAAILAKSGIGTSPAGSGSKKVRSAAAGSYGSSNVVQGTRAYIPLSAFFLGMGDSESQLYGKVEPPRIKAKVDKTESAGTMSVHMASVPIPIGSGDGKKFLDFYEKPGQKKKQKKKQGTPMLRRS